MDNQSEKIYINLKKNPDWKSPADKVPIYIGPKNMKHPEKNWTVGVNVNGKWYNQAAFPSKDPDGNLKEGELTIILTPSGAGKSTNNSFASEPKDANNEYTF